MDYFLTLGRQAEMESTKNTFEIKIIQCKPKECNDHTSKSAADSTGAGDVGSGVFAPLDSLPRLSIRRLARERLVRGNFK